VVPLAPLARVVKAWLEQPTDNHGLILRGPGASAANNLDFSSKSVDSANKPFLEVYHVPGVGRRPDYTFESQTLSDRLELSVNVGTGNLLLEASDLQIKGTGVDLEIGRFYNSLSTSTRQLARGWLQGTGRDVYLTSLADGSKAYHAPTGGAYRLTKNADGSWSAPDDLGATFTRDADFEYTLAFRDGRHLRFNASGHLIEQGDRNGNEVSLAYADGELDTVTDTRGRVVRFARNASGYVSQMTDSAGRTWDFEVAPGGTLLSSTDPAGERTTYGYDASGNLARITTPEGKVTKMSYDARSRVTSLTRVTDPAADTGPTTSFAYETGSPDCPSGTHSTRMTDARDHATTFCHNALGQVLKTIDALGKVTSRTYTDAAALASETSATGATKTLDYDALERLTSVTEPQNPGAAPATETLSYERPGSPGGSDPNPYAVKRETDPRARSSSTPTTQAATSRRSRTTRRAPTRSSS
jgi:YD repeat-containing protein